MNPLFSFLVFWAVAPLSTGRPVTPIRRFALTFVRVCVTLHMRARAVLQRGLGQ